MKNILAAIGIFLLSFSTPVLAHSPLEKTSPNDGAKVEAAPSEIGFVFKRNLRLTKVTATLVDAEALKLDLAGLTKFATEFAVPFTATGSGEYVIEWRGLGDDGHVQKGTFSFTVDE